MTKINYTYTRFTTFHNHHAEVEKWNMDIDGALD